MTHATLTATSAAAHRADVVRQYLAFLEAGDVDGLTSLFSLHSRVFSPFLGWMPARPFFTKVRDASGQSRIETLDVLLSAGAAPRAIGYFVYHWQLKDGSMVHFDCCDVFDFDAAGLIERMTIVYDTHPVRAEVGNKYG